MPAFSGNFTELSEAISYERGALEFIRSTLFDQAETSSQRAVIDVSKAKTPDGFYPIIVEATGHASVSAGAVRSALSQLRPLAFTSAFKMHDLIAEWILRANGSMSWRFRDKVSDYEGMARQNTLSEPIALANWPMGSRAFWALYKMLTPFRNKIVHAGGFSVVGDTLKIIGDRGTLTLTHKDQGAYIRAVCLVADAILNDLPIEARRALIIENDLHELTHIHNIVGLSLRALRLASVEVVAPATASPDGGASAIVNFDDVRRTAERSFPTDGILAFDLTLRAERAGRRLRWVFPPLTVPSGEKRISEGDPEFDPYLVTE
jgi:hypothetical protein